ncbi:hypothetical protein R1sor_021804 [Riccia sorocarpa]|uniref:Uncharacterized protein n=1 Tax=Riccia sorocarpa TaxID=122646 RepID=A0ABD3GIT8_9MARC
MEVVRRRELLNPSSSIEEQQELEEVFTKLKAKWARESLEALEGEDGELITSQEDIMDEIHQFYQRLYRAENEGEENECAREEVVGLISWALEADESRKMAEIPNKKEIEAVVFAMKS